MSTDVDQDKIPNNVNLSGDKRLQRALEQWLPNYLDWWRQVGPEGFQGDDVYLRTAVSVEPDGWAQFDYVKMPDYRWGIFLEPQNPDRKIEFGDHMGEPAWQEVPGEFRNMLRRIIVTQGDTEPASVEQQRLLGRSAPSLYDMRNLFQVNVEEGRHLWAMVYLLHSYFGRDGRADPLRQARAPDLRPSAHVVRPPAVAAAPCVQCSKRSHDDEHRARRQDPQQRQSLVGQEAAARARAVAAQLPRLVARRRPGGLPGRRRVPAHRRLRREIGRASCRERV